VPPAHPRTISNNHYLLLQKSIIFLLHFGRHDSDDSAAQLVSRLATIVFQSALHLFARLVLAALFPQSFSYGREGSATVGAIWQSVPGFKGYPGQKFRSLPLTATVRALDEPFGCCPQYQLSTENLPEKVETV
jgi:hypothetical protein